MLIREVIEGIRMGSRELAATPKKDYTIGFEFEVGVHDDYRGDDQDDEFDADDDEPDMEDLWDEFSEEWYNGGSTFDFEDWFRDYLRYNNGLETIKNEFEPRYGAVDNARELLRFKQQEQLRSIRYNINKFGESKIQQIDQYLEQFPDESSLENGGTIAIQNMIRFVYNDLNGLSRWSTDAEWQEFYQEISTETLKKTAVSAWRSMKTVHDKLNPDPITIEDIEEDFDIGDYIYADEEKKEIIEVADDVNDLEDVVKYYDVDVDELRDATSDEWAQDEQEMMSQEFNDWYNQRRESGGGDKIRYVKNQIRSLPNTRGWTVVTDATAGVDAEIVTNIMDIPQGIKSLRQIFELIQNNESLYTDKPTGLHINIGSWSGNEYNKVDWLKFLVIYRADRALAEFGRQFNTYAVDQLDAILRDLENNSLQAFYDNLSDINRTVIRMSPKMSAVNLSKLPSRGHIEIRATGGIEYHLKTQETINQIQRAIRALEIASDPNAYKNEYIKKLYKILGGKRQERLGTTPLEQIFARFGIKYLQKNPLTAISALMTQVENFAEIDKIYSMSAHKQLVNDLKRYEIPTRVAEDLREYLKVYDKNGSKANSKFMRLLLNQFPYK